MNRLLFFLAVSISLQAGAVNWKYGSYNTKEKTCAVVGWSGTQPSSGKLTIPSQATKDGVAYTVTAVSANALNGFTDVTQITIPASITKLAGNDGTGNSRVDIENFNNCPNVVKFIVDDANKHFKVSAGGILLSYDKATIIRVPAKFETSNGNMTPGAAMTGMASYALAGNSTIKKFNFTAGLTRLGAVPGFHQMSNLREITVNSENPTYIIVGGALVNDVRKNIVAYPPKRTDKTVTITGDYYNVSPYAFCNAKYMEEVILPNCVEDLGDCAFRNCTSLSKFKFRDDLRYSSNKIFANTGFETVKFEAGTNYQTLGSGIFEGCKKLKKVDMSALSFSDPSESLSFRDAAFSNCPLLTEIILSKSSDFWGTSSVPCISSDTPWKKIVLGVFLTTDGAIQFSDKVTDPEVYIKTTDINTSLCNNMGHVESLFRQPEGTIVKPKLFFDNYSPMEHYETANARYYVPGKATSQYTKAIEAGSTVTEMFDIRFADENNKMVVYISNCLEGVTITGITYNFAPTITKPGASGRIELPATFSGVNRLHLYYTVNGEKMHTLYPKEAIIANGVNDILSDKSAIISHTVTAINGAIIEEGLGAPALSGLPSGVYVITVRNSDGEKSYKIMK